MVTSALETESFTSCAVYGGESFAISDAVMGLDSSGGQSGWCWLNQVNLRERTPTVGIKRFTDDLISCDFFPIVFFSSYNFFFYTIFLLF